jgi:hypothetical protein
MGILDNNEKELAKKVYDTQRLFHEHAQNTNNVIDKEFTRIQKVTTTFEEILNRALKEQDLNVIYISKEKSKSTIQVVFCRYKKMKPISKIGRLITTKRAMSFSLKSEITSKLSRLAPPSFFFFF